ncbi:MAG TPA: PilZ domain-containing protein [Candidatus Acidoferrum sp.]|nr:PilZ domain-containing protein [Candidatus Acidoferrum sp.]
MRSTNLARIFESTAIDFIPEVPATLAVATAAAVAPQTQATAGARVPALRVMPLLSETKTRQFVRVPTHAVGVHPEHREYPRATLRLPLRLRSVNDVQERYPITLVTRDISSSGVFFLCPKALAAGTKIEIEIILVSRPMGRGNVVVATAARVKRLEPAATPGWYGIAALFEDVAFDRDDHIPTRFMK